MAWDRSNRTEPKQLCMINNNDEQLSTSGADAADDDCVAFKLKKKSK